MKMKNQKADPTAATYGEFARAYDHFNAELFGGELPHCLVTLERRKGARGYYSPARFKNTREEFADQITMNPDHLKSRPDREALSTLVHEQAHLWQQHFGKPSRSNYHNKEWGSKMDELGLTPTSTGQPGGKRTGQRVTHMIVNGGAFDRAYAKLAKTGFELTWGSAPDFATTTKKGAAGKRAKYCCPTCEAAAWGKPGLNINCGDCDEPMELAE